MRGGPAAGRLGRGEMGQGGFGSERRPDRGPAAAFAGKAAAPPDARQPGILDGGRYQGEPPAAAGAAGLNAGMT